MTDDILAGLGWSAQRMAEAEALGPRAGAPARVVAVDRDRLTVADAAGDRGVLPPPATSTGDFAVGDWVLADAARVTQLLERTSVLTRRAAGTDARVQLIAANVDLLAIVTSCNAEFSEARLERYLALAAAAGVMPLIVLTKADAAEDPDSFRRAAEALSPLAAAELVDARDPAEAAKVAGWMRRGQTLALVGSSGVGKTTLTNSLTGRAGATAGIREDDARGRHTTTRRQLVAAAGGYWILDTPGMRALRLADAAEGLDEVFADIAALAADCRFGDCAHEAEPGCAVRAAIADGRLDEGRLGRWRKLLREDARNSRSIAEARARERAFGRMVRAAMARKER